MKIARTPPYSVLVPLTLAAALTGTSGVARGQGKTFGTMGNGSGELLDLDGPGGEDDGELFGDDQEADAPLEEPGTRTVMLEPAGLSVLPVLSYGLGFAYELPFAETKKHRPWSVRARYARGTAKLGDLDVVTELSSIEATWTFYRSLYVAAGPAFRNVRAALEDTVVADAYAAGSASVAGLLLSVGIQESLGTYVLGCDIAGTFQPVGGVRRRGYDIEDLNDRDPHTKTISRAAAGASTSVLRVYFGPRF